MPINPDFSALEAVITAKVESVATNIDNKDLLIQMKALETAVANLSLTRVIAEGVYQSGTISAAATTAIGNLNAAVLAAEGTLDDTVTAAVAALTTQAGLIQDQVDQILADLGSVNTQDIIDLINGGLADIQTASNAVASSIQTGLGTISSAVNTATSDITSSKNDAISAVGGAVSTGLASVSTALADLNTAETDAISAVSGAGTAALSSLNDAKLAAIAEVLTYEGGELIEQLSADIRLVRDDRWLSLGIFNPTV